MINVLDRASQELCGSGHEDTQTHGLERAVALGPDAAGREMPYQQRFSV